MQLTAQTVLPKPNPARLVVDYANVLSQYDEEQLERKLVALDDSTTNQIAVVVVNSLNGETIEDVAYKTFNAWGIGNKTTKNGVLLLIAINDRKVMIEVGNGLQGAIPDVVASTIIRNSIKPAFKQGNYLGGINAAVDDLSQAAAGEYHTKRERKNNDSSGIGSFIFFIIIIIIILIISNRNNRGGGYRRRNSDWMLPIFFNSGGWNSGGNWSGGGGSGGFGGFGGFGGGSSDGGGASGSW